MWTDSLGTLTISADVFPVVAPEKLLFGWKDRTDDRKYVCVHKLVDGWLIRVKKKTIFGFKTIRIRCRKECRRMEQKEVTYEQALHFEVERTRERAAKRARGRGGTSFPTPGTCVSFRVRYSRDFSRLSHTESLLAG